MLSSGTLLVVFARQTEFVPALVVMFVLGVPVAALNAGIAPPLLAATPGAFRGRMIAVFTPTTWRLPCLASPSQESWPAPD